ncbi:Arm DNA-binding domain-containing protein [Taibaiella soli]|uniref:Arm DNA-binding domain-containing protein n=1 Tax=Taibaiella soli TaxID=1649169 RepID=A0A2W2B5N9_9BACT|nr:Arm DNA-binding domain-containing protein [Taibaiella soli]PZF71297.1 hypothetical protein DN068_18540 [Taibaiella soli]
MWESFSLLFYLKKPKKYVEGPRYVYMRITVNGLIHEISCKRMWDPKRWNPWKHRASGHQEDAKALNDYLEILTVKVFNARVELYNANQDITAAAIKKIIATCVSRKDKDCLGRMHIVGE